MHENGASGAAGPDVARVVLVNGAEHAWRADITVAALVREVAADAAAVATALNGEFVPRHARDALRLAPGDAVLVFAAIVGG
ncbi:MAG: sulfur carrier protein ThiS [Burkholderiaceae bacterium]